MMDKDLLLNNELSRQLSLISFNRSKTLTEQTVKSDRLGNQGQFQPKKLETDVKNFWRNLTPKQTANAVFKTIQKSVDILGTNEEEIFFVLQKLNFESYLILLDKVKKLGKKFPTGKVTFDDSGSSVIELRNYKSVIEWIQNEEFKAGELGYENNKEWLNKYVKILFKFGDDPTDMWKNFKKFEDQIGTPSVGGGDFADLEASDELLTSYAHVVAPIASIIISIGFPPTWLALGAAGLIELGDAALYLTVNKDPYAAGLAAIFAFVPFVQLKFLKSVYTLGKEGVKRLIKKLSSGRIGNLLKEETILLNEVIENFDKLSKLAKLNMSKKLTYLVLNSLKSGKEVLNFLFNLINKGLLDPESLGTTGIMVMGTFYTWDAIAKKAGICNPAPLSLLRASDWTILQKVGQLGGYLQPFSTSCEVEAIYEKLLSVRSDNGLFIEKLKEAEDRNLILSKKYESSFSVDVLIVQFILEKAGFMDLKMPYYSTKETNSSTQIYFKDSSSIENVSLYSVAGKLIKSHDNKLSEKQFTITIPPYKGVVIMLIKTKLGNSTKKITLGTGYQNGIFNTGNFEIKYGYFDSITEVMVSEYQKENGLSVDGVVGGSTYRKLISDLESEKYGVIPNYINYDFNDERVEIIRSEYEEYMQKDESITIDMKKVDDALKSNKEMKDKMAKKVADGMKDADNMTEKDFNDLFGKYNLKN